jgi:hypothetical protein
MIQQQMYTVIYKYDTPAKYIIIFVISNINIIINTYGNTYVVILEYDTPVKYRIIYIIINSIVNVCSNIYNICGHI